MGCWHITRATIRLTAPRAAGHCDPVGPPPHITNQTPVEARLQAEVPCPRCEMSFAYRRDGAGDPVRVRALRVSETGCTCLACGAFFEPERFEWLARLIGCDPVIAV